ncbi:hypothetical protein EL26_00590 [Tumebacillus flagellatus]|uniref:YolD-like protein n=2 Tax=Tumebacillus flagellatus TaxID=1157490 RepID=A0A074LVT3_9BACL|nr:hypothetical protein EL26_00590 [Tumebacillus flagellatus]
MILPEHRARMMEQELEPYVVPQLHEDASVEIEYRVQQAMARRQPLKIIVGEADGEHTVEGRILSYRSETRSLQIHNEWGRFQIPIQNIVRVL